MAADFDKELYNTAAGGPFIIVTNLHCVRRPGIGFPVGGNAVVLLLCAFSLPVLPLKNSSLEFIPL